MVLVILSNLYIKCENNQIEIRSTDLDISIKEYVSADSTKDGEATVNARIFTDIIRKTKKNTIIKSVLNNQTFYSAIIDSTFFSSSSKSLVENAFELIPGQALHARSIGFIHPTTKKEINFEINIPEGFKKIIEKFEKIIQS